MGLVYLYIGVVLGVNVGIYGIHGVSGYRPPNPDTPNGTASQDCLQNCQGWWCQRGQLIGSPMAVPLVVSGK